eukprot:COSAG02_NODE_60178_length_272_cov_0.595376_1_plen_23_part_01
MYVHTFRRFRLQEAFFVGDDMHN